MNVGLANLRLALDFAILSARLLYSVLHWLADHDERSVVSSHLAIDSRRVPSSVHNEPYSGGARWRRMAGR